MANNGRTTGGVSPGQFIREVRQEVSKITWSGRRETMISTIMVLVMVIIAATFFFLVDTTLGFLVRLVVNLLGA